MIGFIVSVSSPVIFSLFGACDETQSLVYDRETLNHLSHIASVGLWQFILKVFVIGAGKRWLDS